MAKYEFTGETMKYVGHILHRIRRCSSGELGGWIESEDNLSQAGDCWVYDEAKVYGDAIIRDTAQVYDSALVYDSAHVYDNAIVRGEAKVYDNAKV